MTYREYIDSLKEKWIGKKVEFCGSVYTVVDVDYNGGLLIDKPTYYCESYTSETTAVAQHMVKEIEP